jgi:hypothetical protein
MRISMSAFFNPPRILEPDEPNKIDKTFRIAKPMRKVSWTKRFAAGGRSVGDRLEG